MLKLDLSDFNIKAQNYIMQIHTHRVHHKTKISRLTKNPLSKQEAEIRLLAQFLKYDSPSTWPR